MPHTVGLSPDAVPRLVPVPSDRERRRAATGPRRTPARTVQSVCGPVRAARHATAAGGVHAERPAGTGRETDQARTIHGSGPARWDPLPGRACSRPRRRSEHALAVLPLHGAERPSGRPGDRGRRRPLAARQGRRHQPGRHPSLRLTRTPVRSLVPPPRGRSNVPGVWAVNNYVACSGSNWNRPPFGPIASQHGRNAGNPDGKDRHSGGAHFAMCDGHVRFV
ncbi:MAG: DUF1559 domain-containing protein, partial [Planctomycetota bacterium]